MADTPFDWILSNCFLFDVQVVGNLIYYRYMNPAIVAPDAFDIVAFGVDKGLTSDQVIGDFSGLTGRKRLRIPAHFTLVFALSWPPLQGTTTHRLFNLI